MLQFYTNIDLVERKSLIIFDEVQKYPLARQAIKVLVKAHRDDYWKDLNVLYAIQGFL